MDASAYSALPRVVLDNGSGFIKIGLASSRRPPHITPNCVGHPKRKFTSHYSESHSSGASDQATGSSSHSVSDSSGFVSESCYTLIEYFCCRPQANSLVYDGNTQRLVWDKYIGRSNLTNKDGFISPGNILSVNPDSTSICVTEPNLCPPQSRQILAEILFEDFGFPLACFLSSQTASAHFYDILISKKTRADFNLKCYPKFPASNLDSDLSCCLVIDCGFGSTHAVPFLNGEPIEGASLRTSVSGFQCNSYLKNITALRSVNLEFNELIVQHMKEEACYVSRDFDLELRAAHKLLKLYGTDFLNHQYILPIYTSKSKTQMMKHFLNYRKSKPPLLSESSEELIRSLADGNIKDLYGLSSLMNHQESDVDAEGQKSPNHESEFDKSMETEEDSLDKSPKDDLEPQYVDLYSERFSVPEILFSPQDIKLNECGIVELAYRSMALCPKHVQPLLTSNIFLCGGSTKFPGFVERFYKDLRPMIPQSWDVGIYSVEDPSLSSFYGAKFWTNDDNLFLGNAITRNVYMENGSSVIKINELIKAKIADGELI